MRLKHSLTCTLYSPKFLPNIRKHAWNFEISLGDQFSAHTNQGQFKLSLTERVLSTQRVEQDVESGHSEARFFFLLLLGLGDQALDQTRCRLLIWACAVSSDHRRLASVRIATLENGVCVDWIGMFSAYPWTCWSSRWAPVRKAAELDVWVEDAHCRL